MGYMRHHAIIVTGYDNNIHQAYVKAVEIFGASAQVSECQVAPVNMYSSFFIGPDGSKEGWEPSLTGDAKREKFVKWLNAQAYEDGSNPLKWVEVQYGDDADETMVTASSDHSFLSHPARLED